MLFALTVWMTVQLWAAVAKYQIQPFFTLSIAPLSIVVSGLWDQKCPNAQWTQIKSRKNPTESNGCEIDLYHNYTLCEILTCQTDNSIVNVWWMEQREKRTHQNNQFYTSHIHKGEHPFRAIRAAPSFTLLPHESYFISGTPEGPWKFSEYGCIISLKETLPMLCLLHNHTR